MKWARCSRLTNRNTDHRNGDNTLEIYLTVHVAKNNTMKEVLFDLLKNPVV